MTDEPIVIAARDMTKLYMDKFTQFTFNRAFILQFNNIPNLYQIILHNVLWIVFDDIYESVWQK